MAAIKDVARYAGMSVSVVSKYLKNPDSVREDTRRRVEAAIKALNYHPNIAAQSLRTKRSGMILVVYPELRNVIFNEVVFWLQREMMNHGYNIIMTNEEYLKNVLKNPVACASPVTMADGVIFCMCNDKEVIRKYSRFMEGKPQLSTSRYSYIAGVPNVSWDNEYAIYLMTRHLIEMGHRDIAFITTMPDDELPNNRRYGFLSAMSEAGIKVRPELFYRYDNFLNNVKGGHFAMEYFMGLDRPPTAVVTDTDFLAIGCCQYALEHAIRVPEDLAVTGMFDAPPAEISYPPITSVPFPARATAQWLADGMIKLLNPEKYPEFTLPENTLLRTELIVRHSTDPARPIVVIPEPRE